MPIKNKLKQLFESEQIVFMSIASLNKNQIVG